MLISSKKIAKILGTLSSRFTPVSLTGPLTAVILCLGLSGCNLFHSSARVHSDTTQLAQHDCTADIRKTFSDYAAGSARPADVKTSLECISDDLKEFQARTQPSSGGDKYSLDSLVAFFAKYFPGTKEFSGPSLTAYLKLKNFLLGGGEAQISKQEINILQNIINDAKPVLVDMIPYIQIYKLEQKLDIQNDADAITMQNSIDCIHRLVAVANKYLPGKAGTLFKFTDLDTLDFVSTANANALSQTEAVQLIMSLKSVLVLPPADSVRGEDFKAFMTQLDLILETGIRIKYIHDLKDYENQKFVGQLNSLKESGSNLFNNSFRYQPAKAIPSAELVSLLKKLDQYNLIPFGLKELSVEHFLPTLLSRILAKRPASVVPSIAGISFKQEHIDTVVSAVNEWISIQGMFLEALGDRASIKASELIDSFTKSVATDAARDSDRKNQAAMTQMKDVLTSGVFLRWKDKSRLNFAPRNLEQVFTRYDLVFLSTSSAIIRQVMRSHILDADRRESISAMNKDELTALYLSVREMGKDLKFIDVRNRSAPGRAFLEMNIFMSSSNGNDFVEFHEAIEWFYQVWSAGKMGEEMYSQTPDKCKTSELDVFDNHKLDHACYTDFLKSQITQIFSHLPSVANYLTQILTHPEMKALPNKKTTGNLWHDFDISLENAFRPAGYSNGDFDSTDTEAMALILSYTEALFINHSHAYNGVLDNQDIWATYPIMRGFIEEASNGAAKEEFIKKAAYSYLITYGEMPSVDNLKDAGKFGAWFVEQNFHKEIAYVPDVVKVISTFSISGQQSKIKDAEDYYTKNKTTLPNDVKSKNLKTMADLRFLFYCTDDIASYWSDTLSAKSDQIFVANMTATLFHKNIEQIINADPKLGLQCLAFE